MYPRGESQGNEIKTCNSVLYSAQVFSPLGSPAPHKASSILVESKDQLQSLPTLINCCY